MNGYFQVVSRDGNCVVVFNPPTDGGEAVRREEVVEYLSLKNIMYEPKDLITILGDTSGQKLELKTSSRFERAEGETVKVDISPDNMQVTVRMIPPFAGGATMSRDEFMRELSSRGVNYGIDNGVVDAFLSKRTYCTDVVVAKGTPAVQGSDASIEYFFNTDLRVRPTLNEDGSVDFFHLNTINHCKEGDLLARLTPAVQGQPGMNVKGERIRPFDVRPATLKFGHNIDINEAKTELKSMVNGHVSLVEGKVFVSNVFEVENVDNSVGNIDYDGSVCVNGNVCENFTVKANGNVEVRGVVEGATIEAGGNIIIARGMNGMHKGVLKAGGNVVSKFIENSTVTAAGNVDSEAILHSTVMAGLDINVNGKRGNLTGGRCAATGNVNVKNLGSAMCTDTIVEVGVDAQTKQTVQNLQKEITDINKELQTIRPVLEGAKQKLQAGVKMLPDQLMQISKLAQTNKEKSERLAAAMKELEQYQSIADMGTNGVVTVTGDVYPGVKICIGEVSMVVKSSMKYCRFIKEAGDVKMAAIY